MIESSGIHRRKFIGIKSAGMLQQLFIYLMFVDIKNPRNEGLADRRKALKICQQTGNTKPIEGMAGAQTRNS